MSYDIELRLPESAHLSLTAQDAPEAAERVRQKRTADALLSLNPSFEMFESETVIELSDSHGGSGVQISLFSGEGAVSVPYWHEADARKVLEQIARYLRVLREVGGYAAYDPQTEREVTAETGYSLDPKTYALGVSSLKSATKKPWWQFW